MIRNYLKTALRSLLRHRFFSFINVFGLAVAMALSMCIIMLVADQMMYDRYNTRRDRIYRINSIPLGERGQEFSEQSTTTMRLRQALLEDYPGVEKAVRLKRGFGNLWLDIGQNVNIPVAGYFADPEVLELFEYELEHGDPHTALVEPYSVVLTKKTAQKLFREDNPVGLSFKVGVEGPYKVTGVLKETDHKTHIAFDALASMSTVKSLAAAEEQNKGITDETDKDDLENWYGYWKGWVYILVEDGKEIEEVERNLEAIAKINNAAITNPDKQRGVRFTTQSLMSITPGDVINNAIGPVLPWLFVYFFIGLAGVVLLTSCFNFTNLSIARSLTRAKEIGVRKVTGAARWQIFLQFLSESVVVSLFALALAVVLLFVLKPLMLQLSFARMFHWDMEVNYVVAIVFLVFAISVGILAGLFPAVVLSGFQPVYVLKKLGGGMKLFSGLRFRKVLLVTQFTFSLIFIISVIVVFNQLQLFLRADHGFSIDNKVLVSLNNADPAILKTALLGQSNISDVSAVSHLPAAGISQGQGYKQSLDEKEWHDLSNFSVDEDYLQNMGLTLRAGKFFTAENGASNKNFIVVNEAAVETFHFETPEDAIGKELFAEDSSRQVIIGVVKNYNHEMLMQKLTPMALICRPEEYRMLQVTYTGSFEEVGKTVERVWANINPAMKVDCKDFAGEVHKLYDVLFGDLVGLLSVIATLAILISCLGLLGMATYATESRIKEVSIRKVLGCDNGSLVYMLSKGFVSILLISIVIAVPAAYFINNLWLEQMAYHVTVDAVAISLGVCALLLFGVITIGSQTWRAVLVNPVDNLKSE